MVRLSLARDSRVDRGLVAIEEDEVQVYLLLWRDMREMLRVERMERVDSLLDGCEV